MVVKTLFLGLAAVSFTLWSASPAHGSDAQSGGPPSGIVKHIGDEWVLTPGGLSGGNVSENQDVSATASVVSDSINNGIPAIHDKMKEHRDLMPIVFELAARVEAMKAKILAEQGEQGLFEQVKKNMVQIDPVPGLGKSEIKLVEDRIENQVNRAYITRVVLKKNGVAYYLVNEGEVPYDSKHLRQILARNRVDAGPVVVRDESGQPVRDIFGKVKLTNGRDSMVIWLNSGETVSQNWNPKPKVLSKGWWKDRWNAWVQKPTSADFSMAIFWGVMVQGSQTALISYATKGAVDWDVVAWYSSFGLGVGTFISTYRNIINSGYSRLVRTFKAQPVSLTHSVGTIILIGDKKCRDGSADPQNCELESRLSSLNIMTEDGLQKVASLGASEVADAFAGDYWNQLGKLFEDARLTTAPVKPFTWLAKATGITALTGWAPKKDLDWNRNSFRSQLIRTVGPSGLSMLQRFTIGATTNFQLPGTNFTMPVFQVAGMPVALGLTKYVARKLANDFSKKAELDESLRGKALELERLAEKYEAQWAGSFGLFVDPVLHNHWQADPLVEVSLRATHLGVNVVDQVGKTLQASQEKVAVMATSTAHFAGQRLRPVVQSMKDCGRLIWDVLNTPVDQLYIPGLTPQTPYRPDPKR